MMAISGRRAGAAIVGIILAVAAPAVAQEPGGAAAAQVAMDPDEVEAFVEARGDWLGALKGFVNGRTHEALGGGVVFVAPEPSDDEWVEADQGGLLVVRSYGAARSAMKPAQWRRRLIRGQVHSGECDVAAKVVGASRDAGGVTLELRIEVRGVEELGMPPVWQAVAQARALFDGEQRCMKLDMLSFERAQLEQPYFVERTRGVFDGQPELANILGVGMDRWATRLDDAAWSAWFGHQGLATGDVNNDGRLDLYVAMPSGMPNMLLLQDEDGTVRNAAEEHGLAWLDDTKGVLLVDLDQDGDLDVASALGHVIVLQENVGEGNFPVIAQLAAPDEASFYSIAAADLGSGAAPQIYGVRYVSSRYGESVPTPLHEARNGPSNHLFQQVAGKWVDVTKKAGLTDPDGGRFSLAAQFVDANGDGKTDLYVVNDFGSNQLFLGKGAMRFEAAESEVCDPGAGMGGSWGDVDMDGDVDLFVTNMYSSAGRRVSFQEGFGAALDDAARKRLQRFASGNSLFLGDGDGGFERSEGARVEMGRWGWGGVLSDFDGDGLLDIFVPAGFLTGPKPGDL